MRGRLALAVSLLGAVPVAMIYHWHEATGAAAAGLLVGSVLAAVVVLPVLAGNDPEVRA